MKELELKYGCNPNQKPSRIYMADGSELPIQVLNGRPGARYCLPGWHFKPEGTETNVNVLSC